MKCCRHKKEQLMSSATFVGGANANTNCARPDFDADAAKEAAFGETKYWLVLRRLMSIASAQKRGLIELLV